MRITVKELIDICISRYSQGCVGCPYYEYKCYEPTYPSIPRDAKKYRKYQTDKILNKEVILKLDK